MQKSEEKSLKKCQEVPKSAKKKCQKGQSAKSAKVAKSAQKCQKEWFYFISATIRTRWEIKCLPNAGFFLEIIHKRSNAVYYSPPPLTPHPHCPIERVAQLSREKH